MHRTAPRWVWMSPVRRPPALRAAVLGLCPPRSTEVLFPRSTGGGSPPSPCWPRSVQCIPGSHWPFWPQGTLLAHVQLTAETPQAPFHGAALHPLVPLWLSSECCDQQRRVWLEAVTSGVPQGAVLGLAMFNVSISDLDEGMGSPLSRFGDGTKLGAASDSQEGRAAIQ